MGKEGKPGSQARRGDSRDDLHRDELSKGCINEKKICLYWPSHFPSFVLVLVLLSHDFSLFPSFVLLSLLLRDCIVSNPPSPQVTSKPPPPSQYMRMSCICFANHLLSSNYNFLSVLDSFLVCPIPNQIQSCTPRHRLAHWSLHMFWTAAFARCSTSSIGDRMLLRVREGWQGTSSAPRDDY